MRTAFTTFLAAALLTSCSTIGVIQTPRPIAYDDLPDSPLNSRSFSDSTSDVLKEHNLSSTARREPARAIADLAALPESATSPTVELAIAELSIRSAQKSKVLRPRRAAGHYLCAAEYALRGLRQRSRPGPATEKLLTATYNHATGQVAAFLHPTGHNWNEPTTITGPTRSYQLSAHPAGRNLLDPEAFDSLTPTDQLRVNGFRQRTIQEGIGAALVGVYHRTAARKERNPFIARAGMGLPITATLDFPGDGRAVISFHDVLLEDDIRFAGVDRKLSADFTAPLASLMTRSPDLEIGLQAMFNPGNYTDRTGLFFIEPLREGQVPVILSHGLMSHPATWKDTYNELISDRRLRENYQFWFYLYPSGLPVSYSAIGLREDLDDLRARYPRFTASSAYNHTVLIGHSMGGLVTSLQVREGGDRLWSRFFDKPFDEVKIPARDRDLLRKAIYFEPRENVSRVIFVSTPHRGSRLADRPLAKYLSKLVEAPIAVLTLQRPQILDATTDLGRSVFNQGLNGVAGLRYDSPRLESILTCPIHHRVEFHTILGDRGKIGPLEDSSDGVVPYFSSHLAGAASEKVVPSGHAAHQHPEGIAEIKRILLEHLEH